MASQFYKVALLLILASLISSCAGQQTFMKSSVVDYLYPNKTETQVEPSIPTLKLPIRLGIAFVPEQVNQSAGTNYWARSKNNDSLSEAKKAKLLETIANHFKQYKFISNIEVIPSAYLTPGGSFSNLQQVGTMYGIDVIALVSYDQMQFTDEDALSFTYWTVVGAYFVPGEKNDTSTLIDTAVFDIKSRKMLFRAPGVSKVNGRATPVNLNAELRKDNIRSFEEATANMIANLDIQLKKFKEKIKNNPKEVKVTTRSGYTSGGGASDFWVLLSLFTLLIPRLLRKY